MSPTCQYVLYIKLFDSGMRHTRLAIGQHNVATTLRKQALLVRVGCEWTMHAVSSGALAWAQPFATAAEAPPLDEHRARLENVHHRTAHHAREHAHASVTTGASPRRVVACRDTQQASSPAPGSGALQQWHTGWSSYAASCIDGVPSLAPPVGCATPSTRRHCSSGGKMFRSTRCPLSTTFGPLHP